MNINQFLNDLHFDVENLRPADLEVDWDDAPLPYKLYRGLPTVSLSEAPLEMHSGPSTRKTIDLDGVSNFLRGVYGLTQLCQSVYLSDNPKRPMGSTQTLRRFAPSGGGLYPNELYVYLKVEGCPSGVYHYDVAHHRLVLLREGNFDAYISAGLGGRCELERCFGVAFVSTVFWKNFFKYHNFAYRLQGLDAGALLGQLLEVAKRSGHATSVYFQFLDLALNHLLGIDDMQESVFAVLPLWRANAYRTDPLPPAEATHPASTSAKLCTELPSLNHETYEKSTCVRPCPEIIEVNRASMMHTTAAFRTLPVTSQSESTIEKTVALPSVRQWDFDFDDACNRRYSPGYDFIFGELTELELARLLHHSMKSFAYMNDVSPFAPHAPHRVAIAGCLHGVAGIDDGAYLYDGENHALKLLRTGDHRAHLENGMTMPTVNLFHVPLCLHVVGHRDYYREVFGHRGYRIQHMEAGMLLQRILLASSGLGMNGHPLLGYEAAECDELYGLESLRKTCLIQVPVGRFRNRRWQGGLHV